MKKYIYLLALSLVVGLIQCEKVTFEDGGEKQEVVVEYDIPESAKVTYDIPLLGTIIMRPTKGVEAWRGTWPKHKKSHTLGPLELSNLVITAPQEGDTQIQADTHFAGSRAHVRSERFKIVKGGIDLVLAIIFTKSISMIPGESVKLDQLKYIHAPGKTDQLIGKTHFGGKPVDIEFDISKAETDAKIILEHGTLADVIPFTKRTALRSVKVTNLTLEIDNIFGKGQRPIDISGIVDMSSLARFGLKGSLHTAKLTGHIEKGKQHFSAEIDDLTIVGLGEIKNAKIVGDFQTKHKPRVSLQGDIIEHIKGNVLDIFLDAQFDKEKLNLKGKILKPFSFGDIKVHDASILFKRADGDLTVEVDGFADIKGYKTRVHVSRDTQGIIKAEAYLLTEKKIYPFKKLKTPGAEDIAIIKPYFKLIETKKGEVDFIIAGKIKLWGLTLDSELYTKTSTTGQIGSALKVPLPKKWKISDSIHQLKGPIWDGIVWEQAYLLVSSIDYQDIDLNLDFKEGLNFYGKASLGGALKPIAKVTGAKGTEKLMVVLSIAKNPLLSQLSAVIPLTIPTKNKKVKVGPLQLEVKGRITGAPDLGLVTNILVTPSPKDDQLDFSAEMKYEVTEEGGEWQIAGTMQNCWKNPLGLLGGAQVCNVALEAGMSVEGDPVEIGIGGTIKMGQEEVQVDAKIDLEKPITGSGIFGKLKSLSLKDLISFAHAIIPKLPVVKAPPIGFKNVELSIAPEPFTIGQLNFPKGTIVKGEIDFLGAKGIGDIEITDLGFKGIFSLSPIKWKVLDIYGKKKVGDKWVRSGGPTIDIEFDTFKQKYLISGIVAIGDVYQEETDGTVTWDGFTFNSVGKFFGFETDVQVHGAFEKPDVGAIVDFKQSFMSNIVNYVTKQVDAAKKSVQDQFNKSKAKMQGAINKVNSAQGSVNSLNHQISDTHSDIDSLKHKIKKYWYKAGDVIKWTAELTYKGTELGGLYTGLGTATAALQTAKGILEGVERGLLKGAEAAALATLSGGKLVFKDVMKNFNIKEVRFAGDARALLSGNLPSLTIKGHFFGSDHTITMGFNLRDADKAFYNLAQKIVSYLKL